MRGKKVAVIAASGGGCIGKSVAPPEPYVKNAVSVDARRVGIADEVKNRIENA